MKNKTLKTLDLIAQTIYDKKGMNILALDVRGISTLTDYFLIAEGNVDRHVRSMAMTLKASLSELGLHPYHIDGQKEGDWVVMDYGDIVIHLLIPDLRERYALEELWKESKIIDVAIKVDRPS